MASQAQKRSASEQQNLLEGIKAVIVDIEGTTTPISFVHDKLFGYVRDTLKDYVSARWESEETQADVEALRAQATKDKEASVEGAVEIAGKDDEQEKGVQSVVDNVLWQMDNDRKSTGLKQLQGHMWREAYKTGKVQGEVYDDVVDALKLLQTAETPVYVYSSGSVEAQKLLFGYSEKGDLQEYFAGYFDTTSGEKTVKASYSTIVGEISGVSAGETLFLTDVTREAAPASEAGLKVAVVVREGNTALTAEEQKQYTTIKSFAELFSEEADEEDGEPPAKKAAPEGEADESNGAGAAAAAASDDDDIEELDDDEVDEEEDIAEEEEDEEAKE